MTTIERFVLNLGAAFSRRMTTETVAFYVEKLEKFQSRANLTDIQWSSAMSRLVAEIEKFPTLNQIYLFLHGERQKSGRLIPIFELWQDQRGRTYAKKTGFYQSEMVDSHTLEQWRREAITGYAARAAFIEGWMSRPGASLDKCDEFLRAVKNTNRKEPGRFEPIGITIKDLAAGEKEERANNTAGSTDVDDAIAEEVPF